MRSLLQKMAAALFLVTFLGVLSVALEQIAINDWLGPVVRGNLEGRFDAGALFYTEVDVQGLKTTDAVYRKKSGR